MLELHWWLLVEVFMWVLGLDGRQLHANSSVLPASFAWLLPRDATEEKAVLPRHREHCQSPVSPPTHPMPVLELLQPAQR